VVDPLGFVLRYVPGGPPEEAPRILRNGDATVVAAGSRFRLYCRPFVTTPEAVREAQPIVTGQVVLAYQGRVDNRAEVAGLLGRPDLAAAPDGQVLAAACAAWGSELARQVLGEYAFAAVDRRTGDLIAGRDALGLRRLVYCEDGPRIWVASDLGTLLGALPAAPALDPASIARHVAGRGQLLGAETVYRGIRDLPPRHALVHDGAVLRERCCWAPSPAPLRSASDGEVDERARTYVRAGVEAALRSSGAVWTDLSGGLDSSTVTCVAAQLRAAGVGEARPLRALSAVYPSTPRSDERTFQRIVLDRWPLEQVEIDMDGCPDYGELDEYRWEPTFATFRGTLERRIRDLAVATETKVNLTGIGGDQVFCFGDFPPLYLADLLRSRPWAFPGEIRAWLRQGRRSLWNLVWHCALRPPRNSVARPVEIPRPAWAWKGLVAQARELEKSAWQDGERTFASPATELQLRMLSRIGSVLHTRGRGTFEFRHPLLYRPLVELSLALPWDQKLRPGRDRVFQRRALRGIVPDAVLDRQDKGNATFARFRGLRESWAKILPFTAGRRLADLGLVEPRLFREACERMRHGLRENDWLFLATALAVEGWLSLLEQPPPRSAGWEWLRSTFVEEATSWTAASSHPATAAS